jgi:uncharacterized Rmd1/YagE family protein
MKCRAYCTAKQYDLQSLSSLLKEKCLDPKVNRDVAYFEEPQSEGWVFLFGYGVAVFWAVDPGQESLFLSELKAFEKGSLKEVVMDDVTFCVGESFKIVGEQVVLRSHHAMDKLAISYALAQSVKLEVFEQIVEETLEDSQYLLDKLAQTGKIPMNRKEISKKVGKIMLQHNEVSLHCDVLDTPDIFWDSGELEGYYEDALVYLNLSTRAGVLSRRMNAIKDIFSVLSDEQNQHHFAFLEWIIIILILVEVLFALFVHYQSS